MLSCSADCPCAGWCVGVRCCSLMRGGMFLRRALLDKHFFNVLVPWQVLVLCMVVLWRFHPAVAACDSWAAVPAQAGILHLTSCRMATYKGDWVPFSCCPCFLPGYVGTLVPYGMYMLFDMQLLALQDTQLPLSSSCRRYCALSDFTRKGLQLDGCAGPPIPCLLTIIGSWHKQAIKRYAFIP